MTEDEKTDKQKAFRKAANMAPSRLEKWLETDDSKRVGW